jgi:hypothetical protein
LCRLGRNGRFLLRRSLLRLEPGRLFLHRTGLGRLTLRRAIHPGATRRQEQDEKPGGTNQEDQHFFSAMTHPEWT